MNDWKNFKRCCEQAILQINGFEGMNFINSPWTIMNRNHEYWLNRECFKNKHLATANKEKSCTVTLFEAYPEAKEKVLEHMKENLNSLSAELVYQELHTKILPAMANKRKKELVHAGELNENDEFDKGDILKEFNVTKLAVSTIY